MLALVGAFVAGVLTTLAPCVLPMLPVVVGGAAVGVRDSPALRRALLVTGSLTVSVVAFTLLLRASTVLIGVDPAVWRWVAGGLLVALGLVGVFPRLWDSLSTRVGLGARAQSGLAAAHRRDGTVGSVLTGAALGPVFLSCSPLYGYVVVTVIPARPAWGTLLLTTYALGLGLTLLAVALAGQRLVRRLGWLADPDGWFRRGLGVVFVLVGVAIVAGWDKDLQTWLLIHSPVRPWDLDSGFIPEG
ncbi:MAG: cytochrome C biogenesis protein [Nocardioides sp.]|nr:cytochrome C biogenesis protein [Nocardioides sp.]